MSRSSIYPPSNWYFKVRQPQHSLNCLTNEFYNTTNYNHTLSTKKTCSCLLLCIWGWFCQFWKKMLEFISRYPHWAPMEVEDPVLTDLPGATTQYPSSTAWKRPTTYLHVPQPPIFLGKPKILRKQCQSSLTHTEVNSIIIVKWT